MGNRYFDTLPEHIDPNAIWGKAGLGRWYKRRLSKLRRRFARSLCRDADADRAYSPRVRGDHGLVTLESGCNRKAS